MNDNIEQAKLMYATWWRPAMDNRRWEELTKLEQLGWQEVAKKITTMIDAITGVSK